MSNPLKRVHSSMDKHLTDIIDYRNNNNLSEIKITQIFHLMAKHKLFVKIKNDIAILNSYSDEVKDVN